MNTGHNPPPPRDPLTPEEREWAERLAMIGPHDGPPPALDSKILAAAQAAAARQPRQRPRYRRWPTLVGAAASLVIVVGMAWQLQPLLRSRPSLSEGAVAPAPLPSSGSSLPEDVLAAADTVAQSAASKPPASPAPVVAPSASPVRSRPPVVADAPRRPPSRRTPPSSEFGDDAIPPYTDYAGVAAARQTASRAAANEASARAASSERRERAAAAATGQPQAFPAEPTAAMDAAAMPPPPPPAAAPAAPPAPPFASGATAAPQRDTSARKAVATPPAAVEQDNATLNRVEVTGSRITVADLPVQDDTRLEPAAWLQRIRDRRDASDLDGARESLALFRQSHPRIRLPADIARIAR